MQSKPLSHPTFALADLFSLGSPRKSTSAMDKFAAKTNLAVSSIEFTCCLLDESGIWISLYDGGDHRAMISPVLQSLPFLVTVQLLLTNTCLVN